jgi:hypothetical protein
MSSASAAAAVDQRRDEERHLLLDDAAGGAAAAAAAAARTARSSSNERRHRPTTTVSAFRLRKHRQSEDLHQFWSSLRRLLAGWEERLDRLVAIAVAAPSSRSSPSEGDPGEEDPLGGACGGGDRDLCQELQNLKEELRLIQQRVLMGGRIGGTHAPSMPIPPGSSTEDLDENSCDEHRGGERKDDHDNYDDTWPVAPEGFPLADLRRLHNELSGHSARWEEVSARILPARTFRFRRYREDLARRLVAREKMHGSTGIGRGSTTLSMSEQNESSKGGGNNDWELVDGSTKPKRDSSEAEVSQACLQNFSDVAVTIDREGGVVVRRQKPENGNTSSSDGPLPQVGQKISVGTAVLLRNLENCDVVM